MSYARVDTADGGVHASTGERSLSSWVRMGLALTILPLFISTGLILWLNSRVIADLDDLAARYRDQIGVARGLQLGLWEAAVPVEEYVGEHEPALVKVYREHRVRVEGDFARLRGALAAEPRLLAMAEHAEREWNDADVIATALLAHLRATDEPAQVEQLDRFNGILASATDRLGAVDDALAKLIDADHADAMIRTERSRWASGIAVGLALLCLFIAVVVVDRVMLVNVERLVAGARRFAEGDRDHRIEVQVPPELRTVAGELNRMAAHIQQSERALSEQARQDPMTGLANRRSFEEGLKDAFARMRRLNEHVALMMVDLDHFKRINDTHGHAAGDAVLRAVGATLRATLREVDKAYRIGGEEFAVLLIGTELPGAKLAAERLRAVIAATPVTTDGATIDVTASIGLALASPSASPDDLMRVADRALYTAKSGGRNRVIAASELEPILATAE